MSRSLMLLGFVLWAVNPAWAADRLLGVSGFLAKLWAGTNPR
jgi:hypothetical protein